MKIFKKSISFTAFAILTFFLNLQCMEIGEINRIELNLDNHHLYNKLLNESNHDTTKALLKITENFISYINNIGEKQALALAQKLIENKANVNGTNIYKETPLIFAIKNENICLIDLLIKKGALVNGNIIAPLHGNNPLKQAITLANLNIIKFLVEKKGADVNYVVQINQNTPLFEALYFSQFNAIKYAPIISYLLSQGADPNKEIRGHSALTYAKTFQNSTIANLLREYNPNNIEPNSIELIDSFRQNNQSLRQLERNQRRSHVPSYLEEDLELRSIRQELVQLMTKFTSLQTELTNIFAIETEIAAQQQPIQEFSQINQLESHKAAAKTLQIIAKQQDKKTGRTALIDAAQAKLTSLVQELLANGSNAGIKDKTGNTALDYACKNGDQNTIDLLIMPTGEALKNEYTTELDAIELFKNK